MALQKIFLLNTRMIVASDWRKNIMITESSAKKYWIAEWRILAVSIWRKMCNSNPFYSRPSYDLSAAVSPASCNDKLYLSLVIAVHLSKTTFWKIACGGHKTILRIARSQGCCDVVTKKFNIHKICLCCKRHVRNTAEQILKSKFSEYVNGKMESFALYT